MADDHPVQVVPVIDGDSVRVRLGDGAEHSVRLDGIDAPEMDQQGGRESRDYLRGIVSSRREWVLHVVRKDPYGRLVGVLFPESETIQDSANSAMIKAGIAYWYSEYGGEELGLDTLERYAKADRVGLWGQESRGRPWSHRRLNRAVQR